MCVCVSRRDESLNICKAKSSQSSKVILAMPPPTARAKRIEGGGTSIRVIGQAEASDCFNCFVCAFDKVNRLHIAGSRRVEQGCHHTQIDCKKETAQYSEK